MTPAGGVPPQAQGPGQGGTPQPYLGCGERRVGGVKDLAFTVATWLPDHVTDDLARAPTLPYPTRRSPPGALPPGRGGDSPSLPGVHRRKTARSRAAPGATGPKADAPSLPGVRYHVPPGVTPPPRGLAAYAYLMGASPSLPGHGRRLAPPVPGKAGEEPNHVPSENPSPYSPGVGHAR